MSFLFERAERKLITSVGYVGIDHYLDKDVMSPGGMSLNFAVHAKRLFGGEAEIVLLGAAGTDKKGALISEVLHKEGVANGLKVVDGETPTLSLTNNEVGEKVFVDFSSGVMSGYIIDNRQRELINSSDLIATVLITETELLFESILSSQPLGFISVDFSDLGGYQKNVEKVEEWLGEIDIAFFGLDSKEKVLIEELRLLSARLGKMIVVTLGSIGSIAFDKGKYFFAPARKVDSVVDTAGAGDAFAASFLKSLFTGESVSESLKKGNEYAAQVVQQVGTY